MTDLAIRTPAPLDQERLDLLRRTLTSGKDPLAADEFELYVRVINRTQLDPFTRQIYGLRMQGRLVIHVSIDGRRAVAARTGEYGGQQGPWWCGDDGVWHEAWLSASPPLAARVVVFRKGAREGFPATVHWREFSKTTRDRTSNWDSRPAHMLAKVAEDHALRKAFPLEVGTLPHYEPANDDDNDEAQPSPAPAAGDETRALSDATTAAQQELIAALAEARKLYRDCTTAGLDPGEDIPDHKDARAMRAWVERWRPQLQRGKAKGARGIAEPKGVDVGGHHVAQVPDSTPPLELPIRNGYPLPMQLRPAQGDSAPSRHGEDADVTVGEQVDSEGEWADENGVYVLGTDVTAAARPPEQPAEPPLAQTQKRRSDDVWIDYENAVEAARKAGMDPPILRDDSPDDVIRDATGRLTRAARSAGKAR